MTYAQDKDGIIWNAMGNGELVGITYDRDQQIVACTAAPHWRSVIGVPSPGDPRSRTTPEQIRDTPWGIVESVASIPGLDRTEVWMCVRRTINGHRLALHRADDHDIRGDAEGRRGLCGLQLHH